MSKRVPSRGVQTDEKVRQTTPWVSCMRGCWSEDASENPLLWKRKRMQGCRGSDAQSEIQGKYGGKDDNEGTREKVMQSLLAPSCWFPVTPRRFTSSSLFRFREGPACVPRRPPGQLWLITRCLEEESAWKTDGPLATIQVRARDNVLPMECARPMPCHISKRRNVSTICAPAPITDRTARQQTQTTSFVCVRRCGARRGPCDRFGWTDKGFPMQLQIQIFLDKKPAISGILIHLISHAKKKKRW